MHSFFFFNDTATTEIYTLSLHDALPISAMIRTHQPGQAVFRAVLPDDVDWRPFPAFPPSVRLAVLVGQPDRKSTRLNSSHGYISYAVFCLKKKKKKQLLNYISPLIEELA